jgi:DDE superfamily endonuclease
MIVEKVCAQQARAASFFAIHLAMVSKVALLDDATSRSKSIPKQRAHWDNFVSTYKGTPFFRRHLRMSYESFCILLDLIREQIDFSDPRMGRLRGGKIMAGLYLYSTIRYLAGGSYLDICVFCGFSVTSFYAILWSTIHAINKSIKIDFPSTVEECAVIASKFEENSYGGVIHNCVGAVDGYLLAINTPWKMHAKNVRSFFSGHYQRYGINIQACCDSDCRFTFLGVGGLGVTHDRNGVKDSGLFDLIEKLPTGYVVIGDSAYQPTEKMVPIFGGDLALRKDNDNFNYFASQLRIRIEMAFGLMTKKWGILHCPLSNALPSIKHLICCIARLHNFCIDERLKNTVLSSMSINDSLSATQLSWMHAAAQAEHQAILSEEYPQWSLAREELVKQVKEQGFERPILNHLKRKTMMPASSQE